MWEIPFKDSKIIYPLLKMVIFHGYVKQPDGNSIHEQKRVLVEEFLFAISCVVSLNVPETSSEPLEIS